MNKQRWIDYALQEGFEDFEIYQSLSGEKTVTWFDGQMDTFVTSRVLGTALRGTYLGKMVNLATEDTSDEQIEVLVSQMKEQAKTIQAEETAVISAPAECEEVQSQKHWVEPDNALIQKTLKAVEEKIMAADERIIQASHLQWVDETGSREIVNSKGLHIHDESRVQAIVAGAAAASGDEGSASFAIA